MANIIEVRRGFATDTFHEVKYSYTTRSCHITWMLTVSKQGSNIMTKKIIIIGTLHYIQYIYTLHCIKDVKLQARNRQEASFKSAGWWILINI